MTPAPPVLTPRNPEGLRDLPFPLPKATPTQRKRAIALADALGQRYPDAVCALEYANPHELLIATMLSAQTTDVNVNKATPALFQAFPAPKDYAAATPEAIEPYVRSLGFFRNKSVAVHSAMRDIVEKHGGDVPRTMEELLRLRGVARKTANVVLGNAFGVNAGFVVDTHIERLAKRFGLAPQDATVTMVERWLCALLPRDRWCKLSHQFIAHGRSVCKARGWLCEGDAICRAFCSNAKGARRGSKKVAKKPAKKAPSKGRATSRTAPRKKAGR